MWKKILSIGVFAIALGAFADARGNTNDFRFKSSIIGEEASASGTFSEGSSSAIYEDLDIYVTGLEPNSVYTVWLAREEPYRDKAPAGVKREGENVLKTDGAGNGHYTAVISEEELNRWNMVEIARHPDNDPLNVANSFVTLRGNYPTR